MKEKVLFRGSIVVFEEDNKGILNKRIYLMGIIEKNIKGGVRDEEVQS